MRKPLMTTLFISSSALLLQGCSTTPINQVVSIQYAHLKDWKNEYLNPPIDLSQGGGFIRYVQIRSTDFWAQFAICSVDVSSGTFQLNPRLIEVSYGNTNYPETVIYDRVEQPRLNLQHQAEFVDELTKRYTSIGVDVFPTGKTVTRSSLTRHITRDPNSPPPTGLHLDLRYNKPGVVMRSIETCPS